MEFQENKVALPSVVVLNNVLNLIIGPRVIAIDAAICWINAAIGWDDRKAIKPAMLATTSVIASAAN